MQNKVIRFVLKLGNRAHIGCEELEKVNMLKVSERVTQNKLTHIHKIWSNSCPIYLKEHFNRIIDTELRNCTRSSLNNFFLPRVQNQAANTFFYSGIKEWNSLPANIKQIENVDTFKDHVRKHLELKARNNETCPFLFF